MMKIVFLTTQEVLRMHVQQIELFGGRHGIRDFGLLDSAVNHPQAGSGDTYYMPDIFYMSAAYAHGIIKNHPFIDGNKRTGILSAFLFLECNGYKVTMSQREVYHLGIALAQSEITQDATADLLRATCIKKDQLGKIGKE